MVLPQVVWGENYHQNQFGHQWYQLLKNPATCWYHADTIGRSAYQTYRGLCGLWLIEERRSSKGAKK
nr:multicopper oxidase domain-containing protein [Mergibacter septicus]